MTACSIPSDRGSTRSGARRARSPTTTTGYSPGGNGGASGMASAMSALSLREAPVGVRAGGGPAPGASGTSPADGRRGRPRRPARRGRCSAAGGVATTSAIGGSPRRTLTSPKNSPRASGRPLLAVGDDVGLAVEDHVEAGAGQALPQDRGRPSGRRPPRTGSRRPAAGVAPGRRRSPCRRSRRRSRHGSPSIAFLLVRACGSSVSIVHPRAHPAERRPSPGCGPDVRGRAVQHRGHPVEDG